MKHIQLLFTTFALLSLQCMLSSYQPDATYSEYHDMGRQNYYCEYCGKKFPDVRTLTSGSCARHPQGSNKGKHKLYEGTEKSEYTCKYCGKKSPSIQVMVGGQCVNHPNGTNKGYHAPAL